MAWLSTRSKRAEISHDLWWRHYFVVGGICIAFDKVLHSSVLELTRLWIQYRIPCSTFMYVTKGSCTIWRYLVSVVWFRDLLFSWWIDATLSCRDYNRGQQTLKDCRYWISTRFQSCIRILALLFCCWFSCVPTPSATFVFAWAGTKSADSSCCYFLSSPDDRSCLSSCIDADDTSVMPSCSRFTGDALLELSLL